MLRNLPSYPETILLTFILFFAGVLNVCAQDARIRGIVSDEKTGEPLPYATIAQEGSSTGSVADAGGRYSLTIPPGTGTVVFSYLGYIPVKKTITLIAGEEKIMDVLLSPEENGRTWKPVVVTAGRFEQALEKTVTSMDILPLKQVESRVENNMESAIEQVPGVTVIDGQANIRGGSGFSYGAGTRVLVLVDDLPMMAGDANDVKWSFIPIEQMEQVEVLKGASSALFGSSALNGVIQMRTAMPGEKPQSQLTSFAGFYDNPKDRGMKWWSGRSQYTSGISFTHRRREGPLSIVAGTQYFNDRGYREGEDEERYRVNTHLRYNFSTIKGLTAGLAVNAQRSKGGSFLIWQNDTSGALRPLAGTLSRYISDRVTVDPYLIYSPGKWIHKLRMRYFYSGNSNTTNQGSYSDLYYGEYLLQRRFFDKVNLTVGTSGSITYVKGDLYARQDGNNLAVYLQGDGSFGKLTLSAGARMETGAISGDPLKEQYLFRSGANYELWKGGFLRSSYGQGFRFPSIAERHIRTQVGNIVIYPNDSLNTERGWSAEVGLRQAFIVEKWRGFADVSYFHTEYNDMMEFTFGKWGTQQDPFSGLGFQSRNIGNTRITGVEITLAGEGEIGRVKHSLLAGYTYINPIQTDFDSVKASQQNSSTENILKYRYRHLFKFDHEGSYRHFSLGTTIRYYSNMENIDKAFLIFLPGVKSYLDRQPEDIWIVDVRLGWEIREGLKTTFMVRNLFNEEFMTRPADLQAPRSFMLSIMLKI